MKIQEAVVSVIRDHQRKPLHKIALEVLQCTIHKRELPLYYFASLIHHRDAGDYRDYISHRELHIIMDKFFQRETQYTSFQDKVKFSTLLENQNLPVPRNIAQTSGRILQSGSKEIEIDTVTALMDATTQIMLQYDLDDIFVKPIDGRGGKQAFKLTRNDSKNNYEHLYSSLSTTDFLFQEVISQHREISRFYNKSVNTLRIHTHRDSGTGEIEVVSGLMRFGCAGSVVDNGSIFIPIDLATWKLKGEAKSFLRNGGRSMASHPDSGVVFDGFQIPFGAEASRLVTQAAALFEISFVGWDIAITPQGPVLIEGNQNPNLVMAQIAARGIRNHASFMRAFQSYL